RDCRESHLRADAPYGAAMIMVHGLRNDSS
ncbi:hypothetical protein ACVWZ3_010001, partial [Bradyrhizobium sp. i1.3.6]